MFEYTDLKISPNRYVSYMTLRVAWDGKGNTRGSTAAFHRFSECGSCYYYTNVDYCNFACGVGETNGSGIDHDAVC